MDNPEVPAFLNWRNLFYPATLFVLFWSKLGQRTELTLNGKRTEYLDDKIGPKIFMINIFVGRMPQCLALHDNSQATALWGTVSTSGPPSPFQQIQLLMEKLNNWKHLPLCQPPLLGRSPSLWRALGSVDVDDGKDSEQNISCCCLSQIDTKATRKERNQTSIGRLMTEFFPLQKKSAVTVGFGVI